MPPTTAAAAAAAAPSPCAPQPPLFCASARLLFLLVVLPPAAVSWECGGVGPGYLPSTPTPVPLGALCQATASTPFPCANSRFAAGPQQWSVFLGAAHAQRSLSEHEVRCTVDRSGTGGPQAVCGALAAAGTVCSSDAQCESNVCSLATADSRCVATRGRAVGSPCTSDAVCAGGHCGSVGLCVLWSEAGQPCGGSSGRRCNPGYFADTDGWAARAENDPDEDLTANPLRCSVPLANLAPNSTARLNGVCVGIAAGGEGDSCDVAVSADDGLPGPGTGAFLDAKNGLPEGTVVPGFCRRGLYPRFAVVFDASGAAVATRGCTCEKFVDQDDPCRMLPEDPLLAPAPARGDVLDSCEYGTQCVWQGARAGRYMVGVCLKLFDDDAEGTKALLPWPPRDGVDHRRLLCGEGLFFDETAEACARHAEGAPCTTDADCAGHQGGGPLAAAYCVAAACGTRGGGAPAAQQQRFCTLVSGVCLDELRDLASFALDRRTQEGERPVGHWGFGTYAKSLSGYRKKKDLAEDYLCCLQKETDGSNSSFAGLMGIADLDLDATGVCDGKLDITAIIVSVVCGSIGLFSFGLILVKDIIPSRAQAKSAAAAGTVGVKQAGKPASSESTSEGHAEAVVSDVEMQPPGGGGSGSGGGGGGGGGNSGGNDAPDKAAVAENHGGDMDSPAPHKEQVQQQEAPKA